MRVLLVPLVIACAPSIAFAVPGPDTTAVLANLADPDSIALAEMYRAARSIPRAQVCALDLPATTDLTLADFRALVRDPFEACLAARGIVDRIEAVVIARGVPLRVAIPIANGEATVSLAAALATWKSSTRDGSPILGLTPGVRANCGGTPCFAAGWANPFRAGTFEPGWSLTDAQNITYRPLLVTMLHGRSYEDAARLITSAIDAEALADPAAGGTFTFMNGADPARGVLDRDYDRVLAGLADRGRTNGERIPFDAELTGRTFAAFFTGTAALGATIEGNTFLPGALVDNVTSFGAVPENFTAAESQVSIARWVALGVAGVHGTVDEPLNNCFPARDLLLEYIDGGTLAEVYFRAMPFIYWRNLVLGDAMAAPYADRPGVTIRGVREGEAVTGARTVTIDVPDPIAELNIYANAQKIGSDRELCFTSTVAGEVELLAVATGTQPARSKGWSAVTFSYTPGALDCAEPIDAGPIEPPDAGVEDVFDSGPARADAASSPDVAATVEPTELEDSGCACAALRAAPSGGAQVPQKPDTRFLMLIAWALLARASGSRYRRLRKSQGARRDLEETSKTCARGLRAAVSRSCGWQPSSRAF